MSDKYDTQEAQDASKGRTEGGATYLEQQGRAAKDIQAYVRDLRQNSSPEDYRRTMDAVYNKIYSDATNGHPELNGLLPQLDLTDAAVDPQGAASDRATFKKDEIPGVQTDDRGHATGYGGTTSTDGTSGMFMDAAGHTTAFAPGDHGVQVTSTGPDGSVNTFNHTDVVPNSAKLDPQTGELTMIRSGLEGGQAGTVTVHPGGGETTAITNNGDHTVTTIDRAQSGAEITGFHSNAPGMKDVRFENGKWTGLPGQSDTQPPQNVHVEANGQISYDLPQGFKGHEGQQTHVTLNEKGEPTYQQNVKDTNIKYDKDGNATEYSVHNGQGDYSLTQKDGKWIYQRKGSDTQVEVDGGSIRVENGKVIFREAGWGILGPQHTMNSTETTVQAAGSFDVQREDT